MPHIRGRGRALERGIGSVITAPIRVVFLGDSITGANTVNSTDAGTAYNITGITKAASAVVTENGGTLTTTAGDTMVVHSVQGMTEINNLQAVASAGSATDATLPIDSTAFSTWSLGGKIYRRNNATISTMAQGFLSSLNALTGQRFISTHENNRGIGGDTTTQMNTRKALCLSGNGYENTYDLVIFMGATNDIGTSSAATPVALATIQANITAIINYVTVTLNKPIVIGTVPPVDDNTATQIQRRKDLNAWIRTLASGKVIIWDYWDAVNDSGTDDWKSGYSYDGVHPNPYGGHIMGRSLANAVRPYYGNSSGFVLRSSNLLLNPLMTGTGGTVSGTAVTNSGISTSWIAESAGNTSASTRICTKDANDKQVFTANYGSGLSTGERLSIRQSIASGNFIVGQYYTLEALIQITAGTGAWFEASLELRNQSSGFGFDYARRNQDPLAINEIIADGGYLHLKTQPIMFISSFTEFRPRINMTFNCASAAGTGTMKIHACQLYSSEYS